MVVIGAQSGAITMAPVIRELKRRPALFVPVLVSTDQHSEMLREILQAFELQSSVWIAMNIFSPKQTLEAVTRLVLDQFSAVIRTYKPDLVLIQGDTTVAFAAVLASHFEKIPVGYIEAGLSFKNLHSRFPEEFNRVGIADIAQYRFVATDMTALNLANEGQKASNIYITGNTFVDAVQYIVAETNPSGALSALLQRARGTKSVLLSAHQIENHAVPLHQVMIAIAKALEAHPETVVIYPAHLNPRLRASIDDAFGFDAVEQLLHPEDGNVELGYLGRLILIEPLPYTDMTLLISECDLVITDSELVLEEAVSLRKPTIVLCENSRRPEGIQNGNVVFVGIHESSIFTAIDQFLTSPDILFHMPQNLQINGAGHAAENIVDILEKTLYPTHNITNEFELMASERFRPVLVLTLTVWHRDMLEKQLEMIRYQIGLDEYQLKIIVFQNGNHLDVRSVISRWNQTETWAPLRHVQMFHIHSSVETGYFGRFLAPLAVEASDDGYFILFDDDIIWGQRYLKNMLRVVKSGSLATRNGRFITPTLGESGGCSFTGRGDLFTRKTSNTTTAAISGLNEDFWISAVLKTQLGVTTKKPRCPHPSGEKGRPEYCACSAKTAIDHIDPVVGTGATADYKQRLENFKLFIETYDYKLIAIHQPELLDRECGSHRFVEYGSVWILDEPQYQDCYAWV